jgi:hydroxypyruvate isomerase
MIETRIPFSANLGFLFRELALPDAVRAAAASGFRAIELHWPYATDPTALKAVLAEVALPLVAINTEVGNRGAGDFGICAMPGREAEARGLIDEAIDYALACRAGAVHVMSGKTDDAGAIQTLIANLRYADERIGGRDLRLLIEPLNHRDAPGYALRTVEEAARVVDAAAIGRLRIMFDCYHQQIEGGDLLRRFKPHADMIGHVQIAAVPDRGEPDVGEVDYPGLLAGLREAGYAGPVGAEYRPRRSTAEGLGWLDAYRDPGGGA